MKHFETWYNKWLKNLDEKVPVELWDDIQDELDLQEVWHKLENHYDGKPLPQPERPAGGRMVRKPLPISSLILLLILALPFRLDRDRSEKVAFPVRIIFSSATDEKVQAETTAHPGLWDNYNAAPDDEKENALANFYTAPDSKKESSPDEGISDINRRKEKAADHGLLHPEQPGAQKQQQTAAAAHPDQIPDMRNKLPIISSLSLNESIFAPLNFTDKSLSSTQLQEPLNNHSQPDKEVRAAGPTAKEEAVLAQAADTINQKKIRLAYVGSMMGIKNTWLLNYETFNGLKSSTLSATLLTYRKEAGAVAALQIKEKHSIATELFWRSEGGQNYREYINAAYVHRDIKLNYLKAQAYYMLPNKFFPGEVLAGGYIAYLNEGKEKLHFTVKDVSAQYTAFDYGLVAGYQANIRMLGNLFLLPSVRLNYNLNNIFSGNDDLPADYKQTRNAAVSFNAGLIYRY